MDGTYQYQTADVKGIVTTLLKNDLPKFSFQDVQVLRSDPASFSMLPCVGVNRVSDDETSQSIADAQGYVYDKNTSAYTQIQGTFFSEAVEIRVWHTNADQRDALYLAVKGILFANRLDMVNENGLLNVTLRGGRDEQDTTGQNAPEPIYWSTITMSYLNPLDVNIVSTVQPISDVPVAQTLTV